MIDTNKAKRPLRDYENYIVAWLDEHGFSGRLLKQRRKESTFRLMKDSVSFEATVRKPDERFNLEYQTRCVEILYETAALLHELF